MLGQKLINDPKEIVEHVISVKEVCIHTISSLFELKKIFS
jgi:hypothetical protein